MGWVLRLDDGYDHERHPETRMVWADNDSGSRSHGSNARIVAYTLGQQPLPYLMMRLV